MSTRGWIAIKEGDQYQVIYNHCDSYPEYLGKLLQKHYTDLERVRQVIALGSASFLDINISPPEGVEHSDINRHPQTSVFHARDFGHKEEDSMYWSYESKSEMLADLKASEMICYLYIFDPASQSWSTVRN
jgi:hypothetical protein